MKILQGLCLTVWLFGVVACGGDATGTQNEDETTGQTANETVSPEIKDEEVPGDAEGAKLAMLEAINQWRGFVDQNESLFSIEKKEYTCEGWGGSLVIAKENEQTRAITLNAHGEHGHSIEKYYFDENDELVMVFAEEGSWIDNTDKIARTMYYVDDNAPFFAMQKSVEGPSKEVETMLGDKEFEEVALDMKAFGELVSSLPDYEKLAQEGDVQAYFCQ